MTSSGFAFQLASLCAWVLVLTSCTSAQTTQGPNATVECRNQYQGYGKYYYFYNCRITNFSVLLPASTDIMNVAFGDVNVLDMNGCVKWLSNIRQLWGLIFKGNDPSFLECLTRFNRALPITRIPDWGAQLYIYQSSLPLDDWIATTGKTVFGNTTYWDTINILLTPFVTRIPSAFRDGMNVRQMYIISTGLSSIREHDLDGYNFVTMGGAANPGQELLTLDDNRICVVELAAFRNVPHVYMYGNPIDHDLHGFFDWKVIANKYPRATALATHPNCTDATAAYTRCFRVLDTSYSGVAIVERVCDDPTTIAPTTTTRTTTRRRLRPESRA